MLGFITLISEFLESVYVASKYPKHYIEKAEARFSIIKTLQFKSEACVNCFIC